MIGFRTWNHKTLHKESVMAMPATFSHGQILNRRLEGLESNANFISEVNRRVENSNE